MEWTRYGSLIATMLYVMAVSIVLSGRDPEVPVTIMNSLEIRPLVTLTRTIPPAAKDGSRGEMDGVATMVRDAMDQMAYKPLATSSDRLRGATAAIVLGARHLVPVFVGPIASTEPAALALVNWAFDPAYPATDADIQAIRAAGLPAPLADAAVTALAGDAGRTADAEKARDAWTSASKDASAQASIQFTLFLGALVLGSILWFRMRRLQLASLAVPLPKPTLESLLPAIRVMVYFMAAFLTIGVLAPGVLQGLEIPGGVAGMAFTMYVLNGLIGIGLVLTVGRSNPGESPSDLLGLHTLRPAAVPTGAVWGIAGWCMLLPSVLSASILSAVLLGMGGNPFDNPVALLMVLDSDPDILALLLFAIAILAPLFEELFFRGFLHARLRHHFSPYGAAMISGLCFAATHMSLSNLLPLWAVGFALAILYDRTRTLWAPMVAHSLWNLGTAAVLLWFFR
jgi:membrane protease YdiL (CAAX protease family)